MNYPEYFSTGTKEIGPFRLYLIGDLLVDEAEAFEEMQKQQAETLFMALSLAKEIAQEQSTPEKPVTAEEVLALMQDATEESAKALNLSSHAAEIAVVLRESRSATAIAKPLVAAMLRSRGCLKKDGSELPYFSADDAGRLPVTLLSELYGFLQIERAGGEQAHQKEQAAVAEGNEPKAASRRGSGGVRKSSTRKSPTGGNTTGESKPQE